MNNIIKNRVIIVHGWHGSPQSNWFPWLKEQLEDLDCEVIIPAMPNADNPNVSEWVTYIAKTVGQPNTNTYLVGHSLGVAAILRYLEVLSKQEKVGGVIMVAGFSESMGYKEPDSFLQQPMDYNYIKKAAQKFVAINSDNDPYVPLSQGEVLRDKLGAELIIIKNGSHLNGAAGFLQLPIVLDKIKELINTHI